MNNSFCNSSINNMRALVCVCVCELDQPRLAQREKPI